MSEVLSLRYNASGPSILVTVDTVNAQGVTVIGGAANPVAHMTFADLGAANAQLLSSLQSFLALLEPVARASAAAALADPKAIALQAAQNAAANQKLESDTAAAQAQLAAAATQQAQLDAAIADQQAQLAALQAQVASAQPDQSPEPAPADVATPARAAKKTTKKK